MSEEGFCSVEEFLEQFKGRLRIPAYQRGYAWTAEQVEQLVEDVRSAEMGTYFLGTIILHNNKEKHNNEEKKILDIVDGQQRVRTLIALLDEEASYQEICEIKESDPNEKDPKKTIKEAGMQVSEEEKERLRACRMAYITVEKLEEAFQLFDTQNGRGKPLSVANLLKAYHYNAMALNCTREPEAKELAKLEQCWEEEIADENSTKHVEGLLTTLLFLARRGVRGEGKEWFDRQQHLGEFQGVTLGVDEEAPAYGVSGLCHTVRMVLSGEKWLIGKLVKGRLENGVLKDCDPFAQIGQLIVNGEDFFGYARTYARLARALFPKDKNGVPDNRSEVLRTFHTFYWEKCFFYDGAGRTGDRYARAVYEALILLLVDRFGEAGLKAHHETLWRLAYHERCFMGRLVFERAGAKYFVKVCQALVASPTLTVFGHTLRKLLKEQQKELENVIKANPDQQLKPFGEEGTLHDFVMAGVNA